MLSAPLGSDPLAAQKVIHLEASRAIARRAALRVRWVNIRALLGLSVQAIIVVEDSIRFYSAFLPVIYTEVMHHSQRLLPEGLNLALMRVEARPKILHRRTFEEARTSSA